MRTMIPYRVIEAKRDGDELGPEVLGSFLTGYLRGDIPEYQVAAFLMAVFFRGLSAAELDTFVSVMLDSGAILDTSDIPGPRVDKHSTGGVGDKVSLVLAPLAAELGLCVPMMSGRGLAHSGGTLDKLEAIPGLRTDLPLSRLAEVLREVRVGMIGQTSEIAPLDRKLYDLRSVTATVPSIPLIAASIMSKKLAEGLDALVLDVKAGRGAFVTEIDAALELASTMVAIGEGRGVRTAALVTAMDRPLGRAVGNALETAEALTVLAGGGPQDLRDIVLALAAEMLALGGIEKDRQAGGARAARALEEGAALERFARMVALQGGNPMAVEDPSLLPAAPETATAVARRSGTVRSIDPRSLGYGVVELGGGRIHLGARIDPSVGFHLKVGIGAEVREGDPIGVAHARTSSDAARGVEILEAAVSIGDEPDPELLPLVSHRVTARGVEKLAGAR